MSCLKTRLSNDYFFLISLIAAINFLIARLIAI